MKVSRFGKYFGKYRNFGINEIVKNLYLPICQRPYIYICWHVFLALIFGAIRKSPFGMYFGKYLANINYANGQVRWHADCMPQSAAHSRRRTPIGGVGIVACQSRTTAFLADLACKGGV